MPDCSLRALINSNRLPSALRGACILLASAIAAGALLSSTAHADRARHSGTRAQHRTNDARCPRHARPETGLRARPERRSQRLHRRPRRPARRRIDRASGGHCPAKATPRVNLAEAMPPAQAPANAFGVFNRAGPELPPSARGEQVNDGVGGEEAHVEAPTGEETPGDEPPGQEGAPYEGPSEEASGEEASSGESPTPTAPQFAPGSVWNTPLPDAPLYVDPESPTLVHALDTVVEEELGRKVGPWVTRTSFSTPIYTVPADQPTVRVLLDANNASLQRAFDATPLPADARPASGSDAQLTLWQPGTDRLWEFWHMHLLDGEWHAGWGGAIEDVSRSAGYFGPESWPGARSNWGATATSLPLAGGLITLEDLERGTIDHALALGYPLTEARLFRSPAQRTDGRSDSIDALPEGVHLRIDPTLDLSSLDLPPFTLMLARAAQRYGIVLRDTSGVVDFYGQDPTPTGGEPFAPWLEGKKPWQLLARFPWDRLQVLSAPQCTGQPCPGSLGE